MENDVRLQPMTLSTTADPAHCSAKAVLMYRAEVAPNWQLAFDAPATIHVPRNARVVELRCDDAAQHSTTRYLMSERTAESQGSAAATGAMFLLLGGLPALATGAIQRTDVYAFPPVVTLDMPPAGVGTAADRAAFVAKRTTEIEEETAAWHKLRLSMCEMKHDPGAGSDPKCDDALSAIDKRRETLLAELGSAGS